MWQKALLILLVISSFSFAQKKELEIIEINGVEVVKGELLIKFKKPNEKLKANQISAARQNLMTQHNAKVQRKFRIEVEHWVLSDVILEEVIKELNDNEYVEYAEPNYIIRADAIIPNDPMFHEQWGLHNTGQTGGIEDADIDAPEAWEITTGDTNIVVGVIDSGIDYLHEDLRENIWVNKNEIPNNGIDDDGNGYIDDYYGWDFINNDNDPMDDNGHGTHVAGIIGAKGNNGIGISGVAWDVKLMALKHLGRNGLGSISASIEAIEYSIRMGVKITNNSWGSDVFGLALKDAIVNADSNNTILIASAGNNALNSDIYPHYPASYEIENIIAVASSNQFDELSEFSHYGVESVDMIAPGSDIMSTLLNNSYGFKSGTSMATPMVTGAVVLLKSYFSSLTWSEVKNTLLLAVDRKDDFIDYVSTAGRLNIKKILSDSLPEIIHFNSNQLNFGAAYVRDDSIEKNIIISNQNQYDVFIDSLTIGEGFSIFYNNTLRSKLTNLVIKGEDNLTIDLVFNPSKKMDYSSLLRIYTRRGSSEFGDYIIRLFGMGVDSGSIINSETIDGVWDISGSPYRINNPVSISNYSTLRINPGVQIYFNRNAFLSVRDNQQLIATGSKSNPITFAPYDTLQGWKGITFYNSGFDDTLNYCELRYGYKKTINDIPQNENESGGALYIYNSLPLISNCLFENNIASRGGAIYCFTEEISEQLKILRSTFKKNLSFFSGAALSLNTQNIWIDSCNFYNNKFSVNAVVDVQSIYGSHIPRKYFTMISNSRFINNSSEGNLTGGAIYLWRQEAFLLNNLFFNNDCDFGIQSYSCDYVAISNNIFSDLGYGAYRSTGSSMDLVQNSIIKNVSVPFLINGQFTPHVNYNNILGGFSSGRGNIDSDPLFIDNIDFKLDYSSPSINAGNPSSIFRDVDNSRNDQGIHGGSLLFSTKDSVDFFDVGFNSGTQSLTIKLVNYSRDNFIIESISNSNQSFESLISSSILFPGKVTTIEIFFTPQNIGLVEDSLKINLTGNFNKELCIPLSANVISSNTLSGYLSGIIRSSEIPYRIISDIKIKKDSTLIIQKGVILDFLEGIDFNISGSLVIEGTEEQKVLFTNTADKYWGRINIDATGSLEANHLILSKGSGLYSGWSNQVILNSSIIENNKNSDNPLMQLHFTESFSLINSIFRYNTSGSSNILLVGGRADIINCAISNNQSDWYGTICKEYGELYIINTTIADNTCQREGGGIKLRAYSGHSDNIRAFIYNSIFYGNSPVQISCNDAGPAEITIDYTCVQDSVSGIDLHSNTQFNWLDSNYASNPNFSYDTYLLSENSPYIDKGSNSITNSYNINNDLSGNVRIWNNIVDFGAYEYDSKPLNNKKLKKSWNLISYNHFFDNDSIRVVVESILSEIEIVVGFNEKLLYFYPKDLSSSTLTSVNQLSGYWIKMKNDVEYFFAADKILPQTPIPLKTGWNLVSYLPEYSDSIRTALSSLGENLIVAMGYDGEGETFYPELSDELNSLRTMKPGYGYWVKVFEEDTLVYPTNPEILSEAPNYLFTSTVNKSIKNSEPTATTEWINVYAEELFVDNELLKIGSVIRAKDSDGITCGQYIVEHAGKFGLMPIYIDDFTTPDIDEGAEPGDEITIFIDDYELPLKIIWETNGQLVNLGELITSINTKNDVVPTIYDLSQNYPNPFNPTTTIKYQIPTDGHVEIKVFNILGQLVKTLVNQPHQAGFYDVRWNGTNDHNVSIGSGVYIFRMIAGDFVKSKKMIILK